MYGGFAQFRGVRFIITPDTRIDEPDKLNGVTWRGKIQMVARVYRETVTNPYGWGDWSNKNGGNYPGDDI